MCLGLQFGSKKKGPFCVKVDSFHFSSICCKMAVLSWLCWNAEALAQPSRPCPPPPRHIVDLFLWKVRRPFGGFSDCRPFINMFSFASQEFLRDVQISTITFSVYFIEIKHSIKSLWSQDLFVL